MAPTLQQASYLAYYAYIDSNLNSPSSSDFSSKLSGIDASVNGPWTLVWGPAFNNGILLYVATGADGTYALAFRGTNPNDVDGLLTNLLSDLLIDPVPWQYPLSSGANISAGTNDALALAMAATDPSTDTTVLDYLRSVSSSASIDLMVTGHSLGAALAVVASAWLSDQMTKTGCQTPTIYPFTFAPPTVSDQNFCNLFTNLFPNYSPLVNTYDVVPNVWTNLNYIYNSFVPLYGETNVPLLENYGDGVLWDIVWGVMTFDNLSEYVVIASDNIDSFHIDLVGGLDWATEADTMHSMQCTYFPQVNDNQTGPDLPNSTSCNSADSSNGQATAADTKARSAKTRERFRRLVALKLALADKRSES